MEVKKQYTLLFVSGDQHCRTELAGLLMGAGYFIDEAPDAEEALAQCVKKSYVLIIVDLFIPGELNGVVLIERIRKMHCKAAIIAFCNQAGKKITEDALQAGADAYLPKDTLTAEILQTVRSILPGIPVTRPRSADPAPVSAEIETTPMQDNVPLLFAHMPQSAVKNLLSQAHKKELLPGQILALDGSREMAIMAEGEADLLYKNRRVGEMKRNETIGEASIFMYNLQEYSFTLAAKSWCLILLLDKTIVKKHLKEYDRGVTLRFVANIVSSLSCRLLQTLDEYARMQEENDAQACKTSPINRLSEIVNN